MEIEPFSKSEVLELISSQREQSRRDGGYSDFI